VSAVRKLRPPVVAVRGSVGRIASLAVSGEDESTSQVQDDVNIDAALLQHVRGLLERRQSISIKDFAREMISGNNDEFATLKRLAIRARRESRLGDKDVSMKGTIRKGFFLAHPEVFDWRDAGSGNMFVTLRGAGGTSATSMLESKTGPGADSSPIATKQTEGRKGHSEQKCKSGFKEVRNESRQFVEKLRQRYQDVELDVVDDEGDYLLIGIEKVSESQKLVQRIRDSEEIENASFVHEAEFVTDEVVAELAKCRNLRSVDFTGCSQLTDDAAWYLRNCQKLESVNFSGCSGLSDFAVAYIAKCDSLKSVDFSNCQRLSDAALSYLTQSYDGKFRHTEAHIRGDVPIIGSNAVFSEYHMEANRDAFIKGEVRSTISHLTERMDRWSSSDIKDSEYVDIMEQLALITSNYTSAYDEYINRLSAAIGTVDLREKMRFWNDVECGYSSSGCLQSNFVPQLECVSFANNSWFTDVAAEYLGKCPKLQSVDLSGTGITHFAVEQLAKCKDLRTVRIDFDHGRYPSSFLSSSTECALALEQLASSCKGLRTISLAGWVNLDAEAVKHLAECPHVEHVNFSRSCGMSAAAARHFAKWQNLRSLNLSQCFNISCDADVTMCGDDEDDGTDLTATDTEEFMKVLTSCPRIEEIDLSNNWLLTDAAVAHLLEFPRLHKYNLDGCHGLSINTIDLKGPMVVVDGMNVLKYGIAGRNHLLSDESDEERWQWLCDCVEMYRLLGNRVLVFLPEVVANFTGAKEVEKRLLQPEDVVRCPSERDDDKYLLNTVYKKLQRGISVRIVTRDKYRHHKLAGDPITQEWVEKYTIPFAIADGEFIPENLEKR
jgi:hypothetical protein